MAFPHWFKTAPQVGSNPIASLQWKVWNRSGGATVKGNVYQFDIGLTVTQTTDVDQYSRTLSAVTTFNWGESSSALRNIITPVAAQLRQGWFCMAEEAVADNAELLVTVVGPTTAINSIYVVADGTYAAGEYWNPVAAGARLSRQAATTSRYVFINTGQYTVATNAVASMDGWFNGFGF